MVLVQKSVACSISTHGGKFGFYRSVLLLVSVTDGLHVEKHSDNVFLLNCLRAVAFS